MTKPDLIPLQDVDTRRPNPMIWEGEEPAQGVFLGSNDPDDALSLLGMPTLELPRQPRLPDDFEASEQLVTFFAELAGGLEQVAKGERVRWQNQLQQLDELSCQAMVEILGEGEVSGSVTLDDIAYSVSESRLPGIWIISIDNQLHSVEIACVPEVIESAASSLTPAPFELPQQPPPGTMNGPAVLAEISERAAGWRGGENHVINFTLFPMNELDHSLLTSVLGRADLALNSGGFGDCNIMATTIRNVWAVQYVNAMGHTILDTIEIGEVPDAARAALEDMEDAHQRLADILEVYIS